MKVESIIYTAGSSLLSVGSAIGSFQCALLVKEYAIAFFSSTYMTAASNLYFYATVGALIATITLAMYAGEFYEKAISNYKEIWAARESLTGHSIEIL